MRRLFKWLFRLVLLVVLLVGGLLLPVGYVEMACIRKPVDASYAALLPEEHHRPESRTLLTYPEWHIVHAYDDYAKVISEGDPHEFGFISAIRGFWSSLCELSYASADHGGFPTETKQMVYTIGVSFTAELLAKAAYEETVGRLVTLTGTNRAHRLTMYRPDRRRPMPSSYSKCRGINGISRWMRRSWPIGPPAVCAIPNGFWR